MSYVTLGAFGAVPTTVAQAREQLGALYPVIRAHRAFISKLIVQWLNQNRGFISKLADSHKGGAEMGVLRGGPKGTVIDRKKIDMTRVYDTLKDRKNWNDPKYDTMRAGALALILKRDLAHVTNSAVAVLTGSLGSYVALGDASAAAAAAQDIDFAALASSIASIVSGITEFMSGIFSWIDQQEAAAAEQAAADAAKQQEAARLQNLRTITTAVKTASARVPSRSPFQPAARATPVQTPAQTPVYQEVGPDQGAPEAKPFPILPVALGAGALAFLLLRK